jgi:hypothetical protein
MVIILLPVPVIGGIIPVQTETYEYTISGLLGKRTDPFQQTLCIRDHLAGIRNDVAGCRAVNSYTHLSRSQPYGQKI